MHLRTHDFLMRPKILAVDIVNVLLVTEERYNPDTLWNFLN